MRNVFRAKTPVELMAQIYKYHGWVRLEGESRTKRIGEMFDVSIDNERQDFVARRKQGEL